MPYYLCRLLPPRPTFISDMSAEEGALMRRHAAYWASYLEDGPAILFGPVADSNGSWGLGMVEVDDSTTLSDYLANDPVIAEGKGFRYETHPMPRLMMREALAGAPRAANL